MALLLSGAMVFLAYRERVAAADATQQAEQARASVEATAQALINISYFQVRQFRQFRTADGSMDRARDEILVELNKLLALAYPDPAERRGIQAELDARLAPPEQEPEHDQQQ